MKDEDMARAVYQQAFDNWINPDILARHKRGEVELPVKLHHAQIVFGIDGSHKVRINTEVKGTFKGRALKPIKKGQPLTYQDVSDLYFSEQAPDDKGFGHITLVSSDNDKWAVSFSFIYGTEKVEKYLKLGKEFLDQASTALKSSSRTAVALGMTAAENLIKARLAASPMVDVKTKTHASLKNIYHHFVSQDQTNKLSKDYLSTYKFFAQHFNEVRYNTDVKNIHHSTVGKHLRVLDKLYAETHKLVDEVEATAMAARQVRINNPAS